MTVISAFVRLRQKDGKFKASLRYETLSQTKQYIQ
jgi:hypothetical protein